MAPYSEKSKQWREQNKDTIEQWKKKFEELLNRRAQEWWSTDRFEMEIGSALLDKDCQDIWFFLTSAMGHPNDYEWCYRGFVVRHPFLE